MNSEVLKFLSQDIGTLSFPALMEKWKSLNDLEKYVSCLDQHIFRILFKKLGDGLNHEIIGMASLPWISAVSKRQPSPIFENYFKLMRSLLMKDLEEIFIADGKAKQILELYTD
ncbi:hypothetical protein GJ496_011951 [Pomphorhynchus laevis]|nr:hypothetical protein GJ496_011951 [Pomphorhynchus laevis]